MLEGYPPFEAAPRALLKLHQTAPPPPLTGDVPEIVRAIVRRCLAKAPADRYPTPSALVRDLNAALIAALRVPPAKNGVAGFGEPPAPAAPAASPPGAPTARLPADPTAVAAVDCRTAAPTPSRRAALLGIAGITAAIVLVGTVATLVLSRTDSTRAPIDAEGGAAGFLLTVGQQTPLTGQVRLGGAAFGCPGVESLLKLQSIRVEPVGRVVVAYTIEAARVSGIDKCQIFHAVDTDCSCMVLETRHADGQVTQSHNIGASGVAAAGATNLYGAGPVAGEWWFDGDVALSGESISLLRYPPGGDTPAYRVLLLGQ
jgi:hypothetical protein